MKAKTKPCTCKYCGTSFLAGDSKATVCLSCKELRSTCPTCGKPKLVRSDYCSSCSPRNLYKGKTQLERYGRATTSGFQPGDLNVAKRPEVRVKLSQSIQTAYKNEDLIQLRREAMIDKVRAGKSIGWYSSYNEERQERYQSRLEETFAKLLQTHNIEYIKDYPIALSSSRTKLVDFYLQKSQVLVEISGFAYEKWREDFLTKIRLLHTVSSSSMIICIFTYKEHVTLLKTSLQSCIEDSAIPRVWHILPIEQFSTFIEEIK